MEALVGLACGPEPALRTVRVRLGKQAVDPCELRGPVGVQGGV